MKFRSLKKNFRYKLFKSWKKKQYMNFIRKGNYDFDWGSVVDINILKLTMMGLQFAKFGVIVDEERVPQIRSIWAARREFKHCKNAFEIIYGQAKRKFFAKHGFEYISEMTFEPSQEKGPGWSNYVGEKLITPASVSEETKQEALKYWDSIYSYNDDYDLQKESLGKAFAIMQEHLFSWWD